MSIPREIPLFLFTYNCNKRELNHDIFIRKVVESFPSDLAALYVFGLEELCPILDASFHDITHKHMIRFNEVFLHSLRKKYGQNDHRFQTIAMHHIGATGLIVITPFPSKFHSVRKACSSCGSAYSSLKGTAGVRLTYSPDGGYDKDKSVQLTFANAHLSAYEGEFYFRRRNEDVSTVMRSLDFGDGYGLLKDGSHTFFMGDLNYRTTKHFDETSETNKRLISLSDQSLIANESIEELVKDYDELTWAMENGEIFTGFTEACIGFQPTYKYHVNTAVYNTKRSPSWCDRILYQMTYEDSDDEDQAAILRFRKDPNSQSKRKKLPVIHEYNSIKSLLQSDHQPVFLHITVPFKAPKSIVSSSGYLQILPSENANRHLHHNEVNVDGLILSRMVDAEEPIGGPTQIYMRPTKYDYIIQNYVRFVPDFVIGYSLWFTITRYGRLILLVSALVLGGVYRYLI